MRANQGLTVFELVRVRPGDYTLFVCISNTGTTQTREQQWQRFYSESSLHVNLQPSASRTNHIVVPVYLWEVEGRHTHTILLAADMDNHAM